MLLGMRRRRRRRRARPLVVASVVVLAVLVGLVALPLAVAPAQPRASAALAVRVQPNVVWSTVDARRLKLDVYEPASDTDKSRAAILLIHGGAWRGGDKTNLAAEGRALAALGYVAVSVEYRLAPRYLYPAAVDDVEAAVEWLRAPSQVRRYHIDPARIGALGVSA